MNALRRGGFALGVVVGLLVGLALALGVALYITKAPMPFVNKVPQRTVEQDNAETERNRSWDPNAPLAGKAAARAAPAPVSPGAASAANPRAAPDAPARGTPKDPAAILSGAAPGTPGPKPLADPFLYFVQVGAFARPEEAEQQRARLALLGYGAKVSDREQSGRTVYRVRLGPFGSRDEADRMALKLQDATIEAQIVRVERP